MKKWFLYPISILFIFLITITLVIGEDKEWVDCSNEDDLYRYINEVPTVLLILIVFVVIIKPL